MGLESNRRQSKVALPSPQPNLEALPGQGLNNTTHNACKWQVDTAFISLLERPCTKPEMLAQTFDGGYTFYNLHPKQF